MAEWQKITSAETEPKRNRRPFSPKLTIKFNADFPTEDRATYFATWVAREIEKQFGPKLKVTVEIENAEEVST
jgi:hypothetical protein